MKKEKATQFSFCEPYKHVLPKNLLSPRGKRHKRLWKRIAKPVGCQSKAAWQLTAGTYSSQIFVNFSFSCSLQSLPPDVEQRNAEYLKAWFFEQTFVYWISILIVQENNLKKNKKKCSLSKGGLWEKEYPWIQNKCPVPRRDRGEPWVQSHSTHTERHLAGISRWLPNYRAPQFPVAKTRS